MNKKTLFLILLGILILPSLALADITPDEVAACGPGVISIACMVKAAVNTTLYIASGVVVILWIITGLLFLSAQGAPEKLGLAKKSLFSAVAGTALVIFAASALYLVGSAFGLTY